MDCANCLKVLPDLFGNKQKLLAGFSDDFHERAQKEMKICKRQVRKMCFFLCNFVRAIKLPFFAGQKSLRDPEA